MESPPRGKYRSDSQLCILMHTGKEVRVEKDGHPDSGNKKDFSEGGVVVVRTSTWIPCCRSRTSQGSVGATVNRLHLAPTPLPIWCQNNLRWKDPSLQVDVNAFPVFVCFCPSRAMTQTLQAWNVSVNSHSSRLETPPSNCGGGACVNRCVITHRLLRGSSISRGFLIWPHLCTKSPSFVPSWVCLQTYANPKFLKSLAIGGVAYTGEGGGRCDGLPQDFQDLSPLPPLFDVLPMHLNIDCAWFFVKCQNQMSKSNKNQTSAHFLPPRI